VSESSHTATNGMSMDANELVRKRVVCGPRRMRDIGMGSPVDVCPFVEGACDMFVDNG
jgi:hypothetical protein